MAPVGHDRHATVQRSTWHDPPLLARAGQSRIDEISVAVGHKGQLAAVAKGGAEPTSGPGHDRTLRIAAKADDST